MLALSLLGLLLSSASAGATAAAAVLRLIREAPLSDHTRGLVLGTAAAAAALVATALHCCQARPRRVACGWLRLAPKRGVAHQVCIDLIY